jgi:hypothetical protein
MPRSSQRAAILGRVPSPPGEDGRMPGPASGQPLWLGHDQCSLSASLSSPPPLSAPLLSPRSDLGIGLGTRRRVRRLPRRISGWIGVPGACVKRWERTAPFGTILVTVAYCWSASRRACRCLRRGERQYDGRWGRRQRVACSLGTLDCCRHGHRMTKDDQQMPLPTGAETTQTRWGTFQASAAPRNMNAK